MPPSKWQMGEDEPVYSTVNQNISNKGQTIQDRNLQGYGGIDINSADSHWFKPEERLFERRIEMKRTERGQQWKSEAETGIESDSQDIRRKVWQDQCEELVPSVKVWHRSRIKFFFFLEKIGKKLPFNLHKLFCLRGMPVK